jgi:SagB-type dehydrogenase family enzyme
VEKELGEHQAHALSPFPTNQMTQSRRIGLSGDLVKLEHSVLNLLQNEALPAHTSLDLQALGSILLLTGGIRKMMPANLPSRWGATAGNLGSVELCVIANRVEGLAKGVYFYLPREHALAQFERRCPGLSPEQWVARSILWNDPVLPEALVVFLGAYGRVAQKYEEFAYRLIQFDAGAAFSQLLLVARTLGISCRVATRWADDLCEDQLNLDPAREQCTGITALCSQEIKPPRAAASTVLDSTDWGSARKPVAWFTNQSTHAVLNSLRHESRQVERDLGRRPCVVPDQLLTRESTARTQISLPVPAQGGRLLGDVLGTRRSVRHYPPQAVSLEQVGTMLQCASEGDSGYYPDESAASLQLKFLVLALRVEGLQRAVYTYDSHCHGLNYRRPAPSAKDVSELFIQDEFADAPVVFWISGNLAAAVARYGSFGHRQLLLRAGMAAHRLWMSAMATGLSGCIVAGLVLGAAREILGLEGYKQASLLAVAAGSSSLS